MGSEAAEREAIRAAIIARFDAKVRGRKPELKGMNRGHDGKEGDWLTREMGLKVNGKNAPDFRGFEMKKFSRGKTTFGDWQPGDSLWTGASKSMSRDEFLQIFGRPNPAKNGRFSWSGVVFPKLSAFNDFGQKLLVDDSDTVRAIYSFQKDQTPNKQKRVPAQFQRNDVELANWGSSRIETLLESKFNQLGWFRCFKNDSGEYSHLQFGPPITFPLFIGLFRQGRVFIDCGMHMGNSRPYMPWRALNTLWDELAEKKKY